MQDSTWIISIVELVYYVLIVFPVIFILYSRGRRGRVTWFYIILFIILQLVGNAMVLSRGKDGQLGIVGLYGEGLSSAALSPLLGGTAGIVYEWAGTTSLAKARTFHRRSKISLRAFHVAVASAIAVIAAGTATEASNPGKGNEGKTCTHVGAIIIGALYVVLVASFIVLCYSHAKSGSKVLVWSITIALPPLGLHIAYKAISTFSTNSKFNPLTGKTIFLVILEVMPAALVVLIFTVGGMLSRDIDLDAKIDRQATVPLRSDYDPPLEPPHYYQPVEPRH